MLSSCAKLCEKPCAKVVDWLCRSRCKTVKTLKGLQFSVEKVPIVDKMCKVFPRVFHVNLTPVKVRFSTFST